MFVGVRAGGSGGARAWWGGCRGLSPRAGRAVAGAMVDVRARNEALRGEWAQFDESHDAEKARIDAHKSLYAYVLEEPGGAPGFELQQGGGKGEGGGGLV